MTRWRVDYLGKEGSHLGTVEAASESEAIDMGVAQFNILPQLRDTIVVSEIERTPIVAGPMIQLTGRPSVEWLLIAIAIATIVLVTVGPPRPVPHKGEACGSSYHWVYIPVGPDLKLVCAKDR
jgi:hypothetical protein